MKKNPRNQETLRLSAFASELRILVGKLRRRLREEGHPANLSASQISVLGHLNREGPATVTRLAKTEGVRPQSMGATVSSLEQAGLVAGAPHPTDGRQTLFSITDACRTLIKASRTAREDWLVHAIRNHLAPTERAQLAKAVELLKRIADS